MQIRINDPPSRHNLLKLATTAGGPAVAAHLPAARPVQAAWSAFLCIGLLIPCASAARGEDPAGEPISPWRAGMLDIHQISTGRGNAALYVFPDGTTMLVDAGELPVKTPRHTPDRPDGTQPAGERIVRYIRRAWPTTRGQHRLCTRDPLS